MAAKQRGVLSGMQVIEYAEFVSGPYVGRQLAELGAEVIKVEPPGMGDSARRAGPFAHDIPSLDTSLLFNYHNGNKLGVTLDLGCVTGRELFLELIKEADVFIFGGPATLVDKLSLGIEDLRAVNPRLIATYVTPFGLSGPYRNYESSELVLGHLSGLAFETPGGVSEPDLTKPPLNPGGHQALMIAGLNGAVATMHALFAREATGSGQAVDVSELEPITSFQFNPITRFAFNGKADARKDAQEGPAYRTSDGTVRINPTQEHMWQALLHVMGDPDWAKEPEFATRSARNAHRALLEEKLNEWSRTMTKEEAYLKLQAARVPAFPTNTVADLLASPQLESRQFFEQTPLPSGESALAPGPRYRFTQGLPGIMRPAPKLGEHTRQVLIERLGIAPDEVVALFELGVI